MVMDFIIIALLLLTSSSKSYKTSDVGYATSPQIQQSGRTESISKSAKNNLEPKYVYLDAVQPLAPTVEQYPTYEVVPPKSEYTIPKRLPPSSSPPPQILEYLEAQPQETYIESQKQRESPQNQYNYPERKIPLKNCFYNEYGYACCSKELQKKMEESLDNLFRNDTFHKCNIQKIANTIQASIETEFDDEFETVVGLSDYAQRVHFRNQHICKIEKSGRFILAYATPRSNKQKLRSKRHNNEIRDYIF